MLLEPDDASAAPLMAALVQRLVDGVFNHGDLAVVDELLAAGCAICLPGWDLAGGRVGLKPMSLHLRSAFPDLSCTLAEVVEAGDRLAARLSLRGAHEGVFLGNRPTGRTIEVQAMIFACGMDGRFVDITILIDQIGMLQQLGIVPPTRIIRLA